MILKIRRYAVFHGFGRDGQSGNTWRTSDRVFSTSRPPVALENVAGGFSLDKEHETVTTVITLASRCAAPTQPTMGTPDTIQLHAEAHNALAMALHYLRQPSGNVPGAMRKAVQALAALRRLEGAA